MATRDRKRPSWTRLAGIGVELGFAIAGLALFGFWIDRIYGTGPKGVVVGSMLGLVGGMYNLIRASMAMIRADREERETKEGWVQVDEAEKRRRIDRGKDGES